MVLSDPFVFGGESTSPVSDVIRAIEAFGAEFDTYVVNHSGYQDRGYGRFSRGDGSGYDQSIMHALVEEGFLDAGMNPDWVREFAEGATGAADPAELSIFIDDVISQGTTGAPEWLVRIRKGNQFNAERNAVLASEFGDRFHSEPYRVRNADDTEITGKYVGLDSYIAPSAGAKFFPDAAVISREPRHVELRDTEAAWRRDLNELASKCRSGARLPGSEFRRHGRGLHHR